MARERVRGSISRKIFPQLDLFFRGKYGREAIEIMQRATSKKTFHS
jgi:hypothetical protein